MSSLFAVPAGVPGAEEFNEILLESGDIILERIISHGHVSAPGMWYDQERDEWVALLQGHARLVYEDGTVQELDAGEWTLIPAHRKHRVDDTTTNPPCIWIALHIPSHSS